MPNWCSNKLVVSGASKDLAEFTKTLGDDNTFRLSQTFPVPEELRDVVVGSTIQFAIPTNKDDPRARPNITNPGEFERYEDVPQETLSEWTQKFGATNWYDWSIQNWGTKWDAKGEMTVEDGECYCWFDTAWSPPTQWLETVSAKFPKLNFELHFAEGGMGFYGSAFAGSAFTEKGGVVEDVNEDGLYRDDLTDEDWDSGEDLCKPGVAAFLEEHGLHTGG